MPISTPDRSPRTLVLWDIDHTLIETRGVSRAIYERAFPTATGSPLTNLAKFAGRTELDIMRETLRLNDIEPTEVAIQALVDALIQGYEDARDELSSTGRALPGAQRAAEHTGVHFDNDHTVLIGDTPNDVRAAGVQIIAASQPGRAASLPLSVSVPLPSGDELYVLRLAAVALHRLAGVDVVTPAPHP